MVKILFLSFLFLTSILWSAGPDFTQGIKPPADAPHDWNLGPTGARGWIFSEKLSTRESRQIYVTKVEPESPAHHKLKEGDVILGIDSEKFSTDPRLVLGKAITLAEAGSGKLNLLIWRRGKTLKVGIQLKILGAYSTTAPFNCPKSQRIFAAGCKAIADNLKKNTRRSNWIVRSANALALLSSGNRKYLPLIKNEVREAAKYSGIKTGGFYSWFYGPVNTLIAEYIMATGDKSFLPHLERSAMEVVDGQSLVGSWGHRFINANGRLRGYGMINSTGIPLTISLVLAKMAGVKNPRLDQSINRSANLLRFYVNKGAIPYGDHPPWTETHDDNGKNGMAAVLFNLLGEVEPTEYFSRMSVACHGDEREMGHTGNFFNLQWAMPSVALSGPNASGAWIKEYGWYYDLARRWDGSFIHQGPAQAKNDSYKNWDSTGIYMLAYSQASRKLYLTGRKNNLIKPLSKPQAEKIVDAGRHWTQKNKNRTFISYTDKKLLSSLSSWSPIVRIRAAEEISRRNKVPVSHFIKMLESKDIHSQLGACEAIINYQERAASALNALEKTLDHKDIWLKIKAADALAAIGSPAMKSVPKLLKLFSHRNPKIDPRSMLQRYLCFALFNRRGGLLARSLDGVDRKALLKAVKIGLKNDDGRARGSISSVYQNLSFEELKPLLPSIYEAIVEPAPSGIMFADRIRTEGLKLFAKYKISEGLELTADYIKNQKKHGSQKRIHDLIKLIKVYGVHAKRVIPQLETIIKYFEKEEKDFPRNLSLDKAKAIQQLILEIKKSSENPVLTKLGIE